MSANAGSARLLWAAAGAAVTMTVAAAALSAHERRRSGLPGPARFEDMPLFVQQLLRGHVLPEWQHVQELLQQQHRQTHRWWGRQPPPQPPHPHPQQQQQQQQPPQPPNQQQQQRQQEEQQQPPPPQQPPHPHHWQQQDRAAAAAQLAFARAAPPVLDGSTSVHDLKDFLRAAGAEALGRTCLEKPELLRLARARLNGWEVRRAVACSRLSPAAGDRALFRLPPAPGAVGRAALVRGYRELAVRLHPDKNPGDALATPAFQFLESAYERLGAVAGL